MRINTGQFNDSYYPIMDGVAIGVSNYAYWLTKKYGKTIVVTPYYPDYVDKEPFKVIRYKSIKIPFRAPYRLGLPIFDITYKNEIKQTPLDLVHAHSPFSSGKIALKIAKERQIPIVATFHSKYYEDFISITHSKTISKYAVKKIIEFYNQVDYVFTMNESTKDTLKEYGYKGEIGILENATDFKIEDEKIEEYRQFINHNHSLSNDTHMLLYVGQQIWLKNTKLIIESLYRLKKQRLSFKMFFIGEGPNQKDMMDLVEHFKLDDHVIFLDKMTNRNVLKKYYARADLFLFPSLYDTAGTVIKEAAAYRCPSLVLRHSNASEIIRDLYNGYITDNNVESYSRKIISILNDHNRLEVGRIAQKSIYRHYEDVVDEAYRKYKEIILSYKQI